MPPRSPDELFHEALELHPTERAAFLDRACEGDGELRSRVNRLLEADRRAAGFLDPSSVQDAEAADSAVPDDVGATLADASALIRALPEYAPEDLIGEVIADRYKIESIIGHGGFGVVYRCLDHMDRHVALKMLRPGRTDERALRKFISEGRKLAAVGHPNVVHVYDSGDHHGTPFLVMEELKGRSLSSLFESGGLTPPHAARLLMDVASGLSAIHEAGIVHRDLSSNNVMVLDIGPAKILDLGLAKGTDGRFTVSSENILAGTPSYMSPEQLAGEPVTQASDLFSFGVIMYEALSGQYPFTGEHPKAILYGIVHREPRPLHDLVPDCPTTLASLVHACLEKRPEDRPASAKVIQETLAELLQAGHLGEMHSGSTEPLPSARPPRTSHNPYLNRVMIRRRGDFYGRTQELQRIFSRLNATPPGSVSIVGERKIGKSSLLNHVYSSTTRLEYLELADRYVMVFLDFQQEQSMSLETFVRTLLGMAKLELRDRVDISDCAHSLDGVRDFVERLDVEGIRLVILMDEFETITRNPNFSLEFFSFLRYLANHYNVAYLTSSARELQILCHTQEIADSPFFNIFSTMRLGVFREPEAQELICVPSERIGRPLEPYSDQIVRLAGRFPLFLQIACCHAIELSDETGKGELDFDQLRRAFLDEAGQHMNYIWDGFDEHERKAVCRIAVGKKLPDSLVHVAAELQRKNYIEEQDDEYRLFSSAFEEFARAHAERHRQSFFRRLLGRSSI